MNVSHVAAPDESASLICVELARVSNALHGFAGTHYMCLVLQGVLDFVEAEARLCRGVRATHPARLNGVETTLATTLVMPRKKHHLCVWNPST